MNTYISHSLVDTAQNGYDYQSASEFQFISRTIFALPSLAKFVYFRSISFEYPDYLPTLRRARLNATRVCQVVATTVAMLFLSCARANVVPLVFRFDEGSSSCAYLERVWPFVLTQKPETSHLLD